MGVNQRENINKYSTEELSSIFKEANQAAQDVFDEQVCDSLSLYGKILNQTQGSTHIEIRDLKCGSLRTKLKSLGLISSNCNSKVYYYKPTNLYPDNIEIQEAACSVAAKVLRSYNFKAYFFTRLNQNALHRRLVGCYKGQEKVW